MTKGNRKRSVKRNGNKRPRSQATGGVRIFNAGAEQFMVHTRVFVEPTSVPNTNLKCGVFSVNPVTILAASFSAPLATMFSLFRVNFIKFRTFFSTTSANTAGIHYSVLTLDTSFAPNPTSNFTEWIYSQPRMKTGRMNTLHPHEWRPIEPSDYNYEPFSGSALDFGRVYFCGDTPANDLGVYYLEIDMSLSLLNRRAPATLLNNLRVIEPQPAFDEAEIPDEWNLAQNFDIINVS